MAKPMALALPLPLSADELGLMAKTGKLAFYYSVYTSEGWKSGIKGLTAANLVGTFLKTDVAGFGYFQIVYLSAGVEEVEVTTQSKPSLKTK